MPGRYLFTYDGKRDAGALPPKDADGHRNYIWSDQSEPHMFRRQQLMKKYGEDIRRLMKHEPITKYYCVAIIAINLTLSVITQEWSWPAYLLAVWVGGIVTHSAFLAVHEVTHHLAFKNLFLNDLLSLMVNCVITVPYAMMFKNYHAEHHKYQGWDGVDTDIPSELELKLFQNLPGKIFFATFQIFFYAFRPALVRYPKLNWRHALNWAIVVSFDLFWAWLWGYKALLFLFACVVAAGSWNPVSGHFISEHYVFDPHGKQETYSYYGPWNAISFNVGYHNEHHDFPNLPWTALPKLRALAPEFYDPLQQTDSWFFTALAFVLDNNVGVWARVKREKGAGRRAKLIPTTKDVNADEFNEISRQGAL